MKNESQMRSLKERIKSKRRRKWYYTVSVTMAAIVVFCTVYALILPAITMEKTQRVLDCPLSVHRHTAECYDENGTLICGQADFVIHTHDESCCNAENELVCRLPEIAAHEHTDDCYESDQVLICTNEAEDHIHGDDCYQTEKTLVCKQTSVLHTHDDACRDENGTLICGKLLVTGHVHGTACFRTAESASALLSENGVMPAADTGLGADCGYNDDGSIWWNRALSLKQIADIEENTPYIIMGYQGNNLMADEAYTETSSTGSEYSYLKAIPKENVTDYVSYQRWYFEKTTGDKSYYIYYLAADNSTKQYLRFADYGAEQWGKIPQQIGLTNDAAQATVFTVNSVKELSLQPSDASQFPDHITVSAVIDSKTYYINSYYGDKPKSDNLTTHWWGYPEVSGGSFLKICKYDSDKQTAKRVDSVTSANTVINVFDYWTGSSRTDPDNRPASLTDGINNGHDFKFVYGEQSDCTTKLNKWSGLGQLPRQGVVNSTLDRSGYPALSGNNEVSGTESTESLEYLFNPNYIHDGKVSYKNVNGLLTIDDEGYYAFNCKKNMAEFDEDSESFRIYDKPGVNGQFFPFNKAPEIMDADRNSAKVNHYFGMTVTTRFVQQHGGYTDDRRNTETSFNFSGDDDVWIFIDDVLVGDLGGIHDESSVNINFATGEIKVSTVGNNNTISTTLRQCYEAVGKTDVTLWSDETPDTYRDGTTHTLKFFYLERGNYDSNMTLKYNLTEIPETAIYKVNQYGDVVPGATFAVYPADADYNMLSNKDGTKITLPEEYGYDENGNITDASGKILVPSLYTGTTNKKGEMIFTDPDSMPYSLSELQNIFGDRFILREIKVPDGYRVVSKDVHLQIWQGESQKILKCDNTMQSGSVAASTLQITATDTLYLNRPYNGRDTVEYCNAQGESVGTLFAVVFKYIGDTDENGNALSGINDDKSWAPVYGSDKKGYTMMNTTGGLLKSALAAAVKAQEYGDVVFSLSSSGTMQLMMENLPGNITSYYRMLSTDQKKQARYTVGYYWTPADSLDKASEETTYRVNTFAESSSDGIRYSGFERVFGANIQIPNLINKVFVQKVDESNNLINGATFAIYPVKQSADGTILYRLEDGSYTALPAQAEIGSDGVITGGGVTVTPLNTDTTRTYDDGIHTGTAEFLNLTEGQYIIKEVKPPPGYRVNTADVMVLVTEDTIYANAGSEDDGVTVGRGPGYLVNSLIQFASEGQIDNTLSWIYTQMQISKESTSFADAGNPDSINGYLKINNSCETTNNESEAFRTYLEYAAEKEGTAFNYVPDPDRHTGDPGTDGYRRLFTTVGWHYYEIYQDYDYGKNYTKQNNANYEDWSGIRLTNLFSRSTYIRVMDEQQTTVTVKKVDATNTTLGLSNAQFRLYKTQTRADGTTAVLYYRWDSVLKSAQWTEDAAQALTVTTGEGGVPDTAFLGLKDGTYFLEEIRAPDGYYKPSSPVQLTIAEAKLTVDSNTDITTKVNLDESTNLYTYTLAVPNRGGFVLPATGGSGTTLYTLGGILLMAVPFVYGYRKKRRCERRTE